MDRDQRFGATLVVIIMLFLLAFAIYGVSHMDIWKVTLKDVKLSQAFFLYLAIQVLKFCFSKIPISKIP